MHPAANQLGPAEQPMTSLHFVDASSPDYQSLTLFSHTPAFLQDVVGVLQALIYVTGAEGGLVCFLFRNMPLSSPLV